MADETSAWKPVAEDKSAWKPVKEEPESAKSRFASNAATEANPVSLLAGLGDSILHPIKAIKGYLQQNQDLADKAEAAWKRGDRGQALKHFGDLALQVIPGLGAKSSEAGEQIAGGDVAGGLGKSTGAALGVVEASALPKVMRGTAEAVHAVPGAVARAGEAMQSPTGQMVTGAAGVGAGALASAAGHPGIGLELAAGGASRATRGYLAQKLRTAPEATPGKSPGTLGTSPMSEVPSQSSPSAVPESGAVVPGQAVQPPIDIASQRLPLGGGIDTASGLQEALNNQRGGSQTAALGISRTAGEQLFHDKPSFSQSPEPFAPLSRSTDTVPSSGESSYQRSGTSDTSAMRGDQLSGSPAAALQPGETVSRKQNITPIRKEEGPPGYVDRGPMTGLSESVQEAFRRQIEQGNPRKAGRRAEGESAPISGQSEAIAEKPQAIAPKAHAKALTDKLVEWGFSPDEAAGMPKADWQMLADQAGVPLPKVAIQGDAIIGLKRALQGKNRTPEQLFEDFRKGGKQEASTPRAEEDLGDTLQRSIEEAKARKPQPAQAGTIKEPANLNIRRRKGTK